MTRARSPSTSASSAAPVFDARVVALLELIASELQSLRNAIESRERDDVPDVLTAPQLADLLQVDLRTLRAMRHANEVPRGFMCGRSPRWKRTQIEAWITKQSPTTNDLKGRNNL